jgi:hypothetical protein
MSETLPLCKCYSVKATRVVASDIPEADPDTFEEYDIYESCGRQVSSAKREFLPGHDAKLKSVLQKAYRNGEGFAFYVGGMLVHSDPMNEAEKRGWAKFMTQAPKRKSRAKAKADPVVPGPATGAVNDAPAEPAEVQGFRPARVKVGRWWKDGNIVAEDATSGVTVQYQDRKGVTKEIALAWDSPKLEIG